MATYFLADTHLAENRPDISAAFLATLKTLAKDADALYILGDLYDYWLGDDLANLYHQNIAAALAALPCPCYYQHGNRDFLLGTDYAARARLQILPERYRLTLGGNHVQLEHGDLLCTDDHGYQRLRRILRCRSLQKAYYRLPRALRRRIAETLRRQSRRRTKEKAAHITDTNRDTIQKTLAENHADILIHGHTHRPAIHQMPDGKSVYVLGDWRPHGEILRYADDSFILVNSRDLGGSPADNRYSGVPKKSYRKSIE